MLGFKVNPCFFSSSYSAIIVLNWKSITGLLRLITLRTTKLLKSKILLAPANQTWDCSCPSVNLYEKDLFELHNASGANKCFLYCLLHLSHLIHKLT